MMGDTHLLSNIEAAAFAILLTPFSPRRSNLQGNEWAQLRGPWVQWVRGLYMSSLFARRYPMYSPKHLRSVVLSKRTSQLQQIFLVLSV